ncbi:MAG: 30S ribosomal protein S6e [Thermoplasmata archaeon]|nr:30S ribosomal protein S6e [Thermoplasmata archaeon]
MPEFKVVISDGKRSYTTEVSGNYANSLVGKQIGDTIDGIFVNLPHYKLEITGGSDSQGTPMRRDLPGPKRSRVLVTKGVGFRPKDDGVRRRRLLRGNTISPEVTSINMKVTKEGMRSIEELLAEGGKEEE